VIGSRDEGRLQRYQHSGRPPNLLVLVWHFRPKVVVSHTDTGSQIDLLGESQLANKVLSLLDSSGPGGSTSTNPWGRVLWWGGLAKHGTCIGGKVLKARVVAVRVPRQKD
jgi:hypothetical protein